MQTCACVLLWHVLALVTSHLFFLLFTTLRTLRINYKQVFLFWILIEKKQQTCLQGCFLNSTLDSVLTYILIKCIRLSLHLVQYLVLGSGQYFQEELYMPVGERVGRKLARCMIREKKDHTSKVISSYSQLSLHHLEQTI